MGTPHESSSEPGPRNFAITGVGGFVAPRHLQAIRNTGNRLIAALDPKDSVGILDQYSYDVHFFTEFERFDRYLEKLRRGPESDRVRWLSVCSPNYLHDAHCRLALRIGADAICEKPMVINPLNLDALQQLEEETGRRIWTVLQLRVHPALIALRKQLSDSGRHDVELTYVTSRGVWYDVSWKGQSEKSGGVLMNIGVHFFDLLLWLFGSVTEYRVHLSEPRRIAGFLELERARVRWFLSVEPHDVPQPPTASAKRLTTFRSIRIDGSAIEFSDGFTDLHTRLYEDVFAGRGLGLEVARPSIALVHTLRNTPVSAPSPSTAHSLIAGVAGASSAAPR
jgi:UDP-N-acetyl-2-amino-2-deoxyglucuronate dehydrogenase